MHQGPASGPANGSAGGDAQQSLNLPPSPTLTNPDMILPYASERETSTPSPPFEPMQLPSPPDFRSLQDRGHGQSLHPQSVNQNRARDVSDYTANGSEDIGMAVPFSDRQDNKRPSPPRNLWALGGHQVGPPLSDIGEEDSSVSSPPRSTCSSHESSSSAGNESPILAHASNVDPRWNRAGGFVEEDECDASSDDSSSTVSAHGNNRRWDGFDGSNVVQNGDSSQGEGNASHTQTTSEVDSAHSDNDYGYHRVDDHGNGSEHRKSGSFRHGEEESNMENTPEAKAEEENMDEISSALLSTEAEKILENAKKRLTFMEGNLSRARTSIRMTPSPSASPVNSTFPLGTPQPVGGLYRSISQSDRRVQTGQAGSRLRLNRNSVLSREVSNNQVHIRGSSETHLPSTLQSSLPSPENRHVFRSMSAMGSTSSSFNFGDNDNSHFRDSASSRSSIHSRAPGSLSYHHQPLDPLQEDDVQQEFQPQQKSCQPSGDSTPDIQHDSESSGQNEIPKISTTEEFNSAYPSSGPPSRTHSQLHVRDLHDQMMGLKTKLSSLKVRTEEDSLKRRSLQSLRTPSPFTNATEPEQWYTGAVEYRDGGNSLNSNAGYGFSPKLAHGNVVGEGGMADGSGNAREILENGHSSSGVQGGDDDQSIMESHYEDAEENYSHDGGDSPLKESDRAALDEILNESEDDSLYDEFHEASDAPTRHEDRVDAFDYEHFFLHSALGNYYSHSKERRESYSSTGSAETTRPYERPESYSSTTSKQKANNRMSKTHSRNLSVDSVSTQATFATATEGMGSDDEGSEDEIDNALNWNGNGDNHAYSTNQTWPMQNSYLTSHSRKALNGSGDGYEDSESSTSSTAETETGISTPRAQKQNQDEEDDIGLRPNRQTQIFHAPNGRDNPESRPTSSLVSSLVSSVSTSPSRPRTPGGSSTSQLNNDDTVALERLFKSLGKVCLSLQESTELNGASEADARTVTILRRRLDAARRVLDGELDS